MDTKQRIENHHQVTELTRAYIIAKEEGKDEKAVEILNEAISIRLSEGFAYAYSINEHPLHCCLIGGNEDWGIAKTREELDSQVKIWDLKEVLTLVK